MQHRSEIDGLRAVAVIPVLLFHMGVISGGYLGVDVFFIISGYLGSVDISLDPRQKSLIFEHSSAVYTLVNEQRSAENQRFMPGIVEMSTDPNYRYIASGTT